ncbi:16957_t:CDS:2, partial [Racocetra fulgida]
WKNEVHQGAFVINSAPLLDVATAQVCCQRVDTVKICSLPYGSQLPTSSECGVIRCVEGCNKSNAPHESNKHHEPHKQHEPPKNYEPNEPHKHH